MYEDDSHRELTLSCKKDEKEEIVIIEDDSYSIYFYVSSWDIIKQEIDKLIQE